MRGAGCLVRNFCENCSNTRLLFCWWCQSKVNDASCNQCVQLFDLDHFVGNRILSKTRLTVHSLSECSVALTAVIHINWWPQVSWIFFGYLDFSYTGIILQFERGISEYILKWNFGILECNFGMEFQKEIS